MWSTKVSSGVAMLTNSPVNLLTRSAFYNPAKRRQKKVRMDSRAIEKTRVRNEEKMLNVEFFKSGRMEVEVGK